MIAIAPKALRFARLAAEQQPQFSGDPEIEVIRDVERQFRQRRADERIGHYVPISDRTADFCISVIAALLSHKDRFRSSDWDGNDFAYLEAAVEALRVQLSRSNAPQV